MATRLDFRVLGPLAVRVDGADVPIGGPKQRALLALLLLSANRVVPREQLIDELFVEQSVNSADHALRNHVSRLRKVLAPAALDEPRIVARAPGYLLRVEPGELDLERFEGLVAEGREALGGGDAAAAAAALREAEMLWHGRPLADLELEPFTRIEVERLQELRLAAVEERIEAELALGRQRALVPELESLTVEHPYRERFRAQLMLAMYRAGRQADGLEVYRQTRTLLQDELGLEPGTELQEMQRAILVQDPALTLPANGAGAPRRPPLDVCPFKGLAPFEAADAELFFGRERLVGELVGRLREAPFLALVGASGSGKSSLLRAGLLPALDREAVILRPNDGLPAAGGTDVLAVDQFEELFALTFGEEARRAFVDALVEHAWDPERRTLVLLALRADFFGHLARYPQLSDLVGPNHVLLGAMTGGELRRAIEGPAERVGLEVEPALVDALVDDVAGEPGALPLLSTSLVDLWDEREDHRLTLSAYERSGGVHGAVARHAEAAFRSLGVHDRALARRILLRLVAGGAGETLTRRRVVLAELDVDDEPVRRVVDVLVSRRLLVADETTVELVHDALLEHWPRLKAWLEEDAQSRSVHLHLAQAASEWAAAGRDPGELYRGARLAAALEWADTAALNRVEREFLAESRDAHARATRRLRALLAVALLLLAAALVAGAVALAARGSAKRQATAAIAQRLGAQALAEPRLDRSLLLAREGVRLDDSPATRSNLLAALLRSPAALAVLHGPDPQVLEDALSPDGRLLAIGGNNGTVSIFDTRTLRAVGPSFRGAGAGLAYCGAIVRPVRALAFSPDGRTLAVGDFDGNHPLLYLADARTLRPTANEKGRSGATDDVAYAADGRTMITAATTTCAIHAPPEQLTLRRAADGAALRRSRTIVGGRLIGFAGGGRSILVTEGETMSYLLDARTFARLRTFHVSGTAAVSPVADSAAFGEDDGTVELVDLRTGAAHAMDRRASGQVIGIAFSRDGKVLATTSDDGSVAVWDVPTASLRETFTGHAGAAVAPVFSPDGATLYTASRDGSVIVWDVFGARRLGRPFRFAPVAAGGAGFHAHANGSGAVAVSPDSSLFVTSPGPDRVTVWRARDLTVVAKLRGPCGPVQSLAFSHDGRLVAATGDGSTTVVWAVSTHRVVDLLASARRGSDGVNFSPDDRIVGTAGQDGNVRLFDVRTGRRIALLRSRGTMNDLDFSSDGRVVATGLFGDISIWNARTHVLQRRIVHHDALIAIRLSPDGGEIATGDLKGNVDLWNTATGAHVGTLGGQNGYVASVTWSPDGRSIMTTSSDGKFRLWDVAARKLVGAPLPGDEEGGWGTYFPNGKEIVATFWSGRGVVWSVDPAAWKRAACSIAHRNLTRAEWHDFLPERPYGRVCG